MAHDLNFENGKASMFYSGDEPWHKLGTRLDGPATSEEAIQAANLNWKVVKLPLMAIDPRSRSVMTVPDRFAVVQEHKIGKQDCQVLGIVGKDYTPLQNTEAFAFFDSIVGKEEVIYHTAGALGKGERVWILAKLPTDIIVMGDDHVEKYLLLSNSHDGSSCVDIKFTPIRVVCQNTLMAALKAGRTLHVPHLRDVKERMKKAGELLGIIGDAYADIETSFKKMVAYAMNDEKLKKYIADVLPLSKGEDKERQEVEDKIVLYRRDRATELYETGKGNELKGVKDTMWAAYNGVTEMVDYTRKVYGERRLESVWFGEGARIKQRAYGKAVELVSVK